MISNKDPNGSVSVSNMPTFPPQSDNNRIVKPHDDAEPRSANPPLGCETGHFAATISTCNGIQHRLMKLALIFVCTILYQGACAEKKDLNTKAKEFLPAVPASACKTYIIMYLNHSFAPILIMRQRLLGILP